MGFDPRGVGYSTNINCPEPGDNPGPLPDGPLARDTARRLYDAQVRDNAACGRSDPAFLAQLTTLNVARDLDRIRTGLHERKLNFLGISWGTWLGVVYRSTFPTSVGRMFLDSVAIPRFSIPAFEKGRDAAAVALRTGYDTNPRRFTDIDDTFDGDFIALAASQDAPAWPLASQVLKELRDATGPTAPPTVKEVVSEPEPPSEPPADLPEQGNRTMNRAAFCNEDPARLGFDAAWAAYRQRLADNPMTSPNRGFSAGCAGWPLPVQQVRLRPGGGSLVLSGHRFETPSPYEWTWQTKAIVGGTVYTVNDDVHGSVLRVPECAADLLTYFTTGEIDHGCAGVPVPTGPDLPSAEALSRTDRAQRIDQRESLAISSGWTVADTVVRGT
ncbi:alpha/beta fold hydrolase [Winogradskya humida]|uniref:alpha/beta fold hydrolase n=1 Tax=Winogradskya humida TaxID=113566 RepID=UPI0034DB2308